MKKKLGWLGGFLLAALLAAFPAKVSLAAEEDYGYTLTIYAGAMGSFTGSGGIESGNASVLGDRITIDGLKYGDEVAIPADFFDSLQLNDGDDGRYYAQGLCYAGQDKVFSLSHTFTIEIEEDTELVVAYGVTTGRVGYTVRYLLRETGEELMEPHTGYGNVGEQIIVGHASIPGYTPYALNLTNSGGLSSNEANNVFTFYYYPTGTLTITDTDITTLYNVIPGETAVTTVTQAGGGGGGAAIADQETPLANVDIDGDGQADAADLVDIGETETPLEDIALDEDLSEPGALRNLLPIYISIILLALAGFFGGFLFLKKVKKKEEEEEED